MENEYITLKTHKHLIGKRAKFKNNLAGYTRHLWNATGTIQQLHQVTEGDLNHVGLSLVFDEPINHMESCYIAPNSYELLEAEQ